MTFCKCKLSTLIIDDSVNQRVVRIGMDSVRRTMFLDSFQVARKCSLLVASRITISCQNVYNV